MWPNVPWEIKTVTFMPPTWTFSPPLRMREPHTGSADSLLESLGLETGPHSLGLLQGQTWAASWQVYLLFAFCFSVLALGAPSWNTKLLPSEPRHLRALTSSSSGIPRFPAE